MKQVTFAQYGCGRMGKNIAKYAMEKGGKLLAAFDMNPDIIGKNFGDVVGIKKIEAKIYAATEAHDILKELKPDICIITTQSLMKDVKDIMITCARTGVNAISTCEEAIYPWNSSPAITKEIDKVAKETGCTITGTGANESQYGGMFAIFGGNTQKTNKIVATAQYNVDDYGIALARGHGVGMTPEEFEKKIAAADNVSEEERTKLIERGEFLPSYVWNTNGWLCDYLGLSVRNQTQKCTPKYSKGDVRSKTMNEVIQAGRVVGMGAKCITETEEGITIETECIGIVYGPDDEDTNISITYGVPDTNMVISRPATVEMTCATIVNRIPDVINAPAGFVTTSRMPVLKFKAHDLGEYCK